MYITHVRLLLLSVCPCVIRGAPLLMYAHGDRRASRRAWMIEKHLLIARKYLLVRDVHR